MKLLALLLVTISFGLLAAANPDPDACGDPAMPPPVDKTSCGDFLSDLGCKWDSDFISCVQRCRREKGLDRLIYHNHRYYDITVEEYDRIMAAEEKAAACRTKTALKTKTTKKADASSTGKKTGASTTSKKSGFKTVTRTITHVARWPTELQAAGTKTFATVWSNGTPIVASKTSDLATTQTSEPEDEDEYDTHHPRLDHFCQKTSQVAKCRVKCGIHILGGFQKCMKKCHAKCHKKHPVHPDGEMVKRDDSTQTFSTSFRIATPTVTKAVEASATKITGHKEEHHHPRIDHYCSSELQMYKCRQKCAHHDLIFGIGKKRCEHKCHEKCHKKHPLFPDGEDKGMVKRADDDTVPDDAALNQAINDVIDTAIDTIRNQTSVIANAANFNLTERSEGHKRPYCSSDNVIMGCKALAQLWAPSYDKIYDKCIKRCLKRHGPDS